jgi:hypothetical protein
VIDRLHFVMACEDAAALEHAQRVCRNLVGRLDEGFEFDSVCWTFDELADVPLRVSAAGQAAMADIVLVACHGNQPLPPWVRAWLDLWAGYNANPSALVLLLHPQNGPATHRSELLWHLERTAALGQMDFFVSEGRPCQAGPAGLEEPATTAARAEASSDWAVAPRG